VATTYSTDATTQSRIGDDSSPASDGTSGDGNGAGDEPDAASLCQAPATSSLCLPSSAPCLTGGNALWIQTTGDTRIYNGTALVDGPGSWTATSQSYNTQNDVVVLQTPYSSSPNAFSWRLVFMTEELKKTLQPGVIYAPTDNTYHVHTTPLPDLDVDYETGCNEYQGSVGAFELQDFEVMGDSGDNTLESITAVFTIQCIGYPGTLYGCVHYSR
jgi:hypothetical protein